MEFLIYLAGPIKGQSYDEATEWRAEAAKILSPIVCLSPMRHKEMLTNNPSLDAAESKYDDPFLQQKGVIAQDLFDVRRADLVLFNFLPAHIISKGSLIEFGYAKALNKPIITVLQDGNIHEHMFVRELSDFTVETLDIGLSVAKRVLLP